MYSEYSTTGLQYNETDRLNLLIFWAALRIIADVVRTKTPRRSDEAAVDNWLTEP